MSQLTLGRLTAGLYVRNTVFRARSFFLLALLGIDIVLVGTFMSEGADADAARQVTSQVMLGFGVPFVALLYGIAVVRDELDMGTMTYLLTRPISRSTIYISRLIAAVVTVAITCGSIGVLNVVLLPSDAPVAMVSSMLLGAVVYTAVFAALGALINRPFLVGIIYTVLVELSFSQTPMGTRYVTIRANLENIGGMVEIPEVLVSLVGEPPPVLSSVLMVLGVTVAAVLLGANVFKRREYIGKPAKV